MAKYVNNSIDESNEPEFLIDVDDEDLAWDLPDAGNDPDLDSEEAAAWEAGTLALLDEEQNTSDRHVIDDIEEELREEWAADHEDVDADIDDADHHDEYRDNSGYPDDVMPEQDDEIHTMELPSLDVPADTGMIEIIDEGVPSDTGVIEIIDEGVPSDTGVIEIIDEGVPSDTGMIEIIDEGIPEGIPADDLGSDTGIIEIIDEGVPSDTDLIPIIDAEDITGADALEMPHASDDAIADEEEPADDQAPARRHRTALDYAIWIAGAAAAALAIVAGLRYRNVLEVRAEAARYRTLGSAIAGIGTIGEDRITAIKAERMQKDADRKEAERKAAEKAELVANEGTIPVSMTLSTVQSDLKIKIHGESGSLIQDVPFKVSVTLPSGKTAEYEDDDQDGIIYQTGLSKGTYKVTMEPLVAAVDDGADITETEEYKSYSQYKIPTDTQTISVTDKIAYTAIDVSDEIKSTSQVNVAAEDTQQKLATESALQDTVEYVASTTTAEEDALYEVVDKADIVDPNVTARTDLVIGKFRMLAEDTADETATASEDDGNDGSNGSTESSTEAGETTQDKRSYTTTIKGSTTVAAGGTTLITASTDEPGATTYTWQLDGDAISIDRTDGKTVTVTGNHEGTATLTATAHLVAEDADPTENVVSTTITVTAAEETSTKRITVSPSSVTLAAGKTQSLSVTVEGLEDSAVTYESAEPMIAEVSGDGLITAHTVGETTITVTANADVSLKQSVKVKIVETETNADGNTLLKDKDGNQIYVKDNGAYREATAADYSTFDTFYRKVEGKAATSGFKYTGWQNIGGKTYYFNSAGEPVTGNQVINGATYTFGADGALTSGTSKVGIDVSQWNGSISWSQVASSGISYAIIRCGYRGSSTGALIKDPSFATNMAGATAAGLKVGIYVFSQATNEVEAVEEASMAISLASGYPVSLPIFIDVEAAGGRADGLSASQRTAVVSAFCQTVQAAGYSAGVYSNTNWLSERLNTPALTSYHIWVAQYSSSLSYARTRYDIWQYSSKGRVAGISGDVDMNMSYRSY